MRLAVSFFIRGLDLAISKVKMSRARKEKHYSRRLAKSRIHHSPPLEDYPASRIDAQFE